MLLFLVAAPAFIKPITTPTRVSKPQGHTSITIVKKAIPPFPTFRRTTYKGITTVTITVQPKATTITSEEELQLQLTNSDSISPTSLISDTSLQILISSTSVSIPDPSITATSLTTQEPTTGIHITTFELGEGKQLIHSGALTGTALATDGSTFVPLPISTSASNSKSNSNRLSKPIIFGIAIGGCIVLVSLVAVLFWCFRKRTYKKDSQNNNSTNLQPRKAGVGLYRQMRQSSQILREKIGHPSAPIYRQYPPVSVRDLQDIAPWNTSRSNASGSTQNVLLPLSSLTSNAISPYGNHATNNSFAEKNLSATSSLYSSPAVSMTSNVHFQHPGTEENTGKPLTPTPSPYWQDTDQDQFLTSPYTIRQSFSSTTNHPAATESFELQPTPNRESIWDDNISIVGPCVNMKSNTYPGIAQRGQEEDSNPSSAKNARRASSMLSDHQYTSTWRKNALNSFSIPSNHSSLHIPESGTWRQRDRGSMQQNNKLNGDGRDSWKEGDYDPRDDLHLKRQEIKGLRVSVLLAKNTWEKARKLFSSEGS